MTIRERSVTVKQIPEMVNGKVGHLFLREIESCMEMHRPRMVLDCSNIRHLDKSVVHLLLCCLEEAMKRNGDIKLAALPPQAAIMLQRIGVHRLFDVYQTAAEAVDSFHCLPTATASTTFATLPSEPEPASSV